MSNGMVPRQRSFAGPIVLILIGVAFLLRNLHLVNWGVLGLVRQVGGPLC